MIVLVLERFHDYEEQQYFIDTDLLDTSNPVEGMVLELVNRPQQCDCLEHKFLVSLHINVDKMRLTGDPFWEEPTYFQKAKVTDHQSMQKVLHLTMFFDC